jgi:hypothetical protein
MIGHCVLHVDIILPVSVLCCGTMRVFFCPAFPTTTVIRQMTVFCLAIPISALLTHALVVGSVPLPGSALSSTQVRSSSFVEAPARPTQAWTVPLHDAHARAHAHDPRARKLAWDWPWDSTADPVSTNVDRVDSRALGRGRGNGHGHGHVHEHEHEHGHDQDRARAISDRLSTSRIGAHPIPSHPTSSVAVDAIRVFERACLVGYALLFSGGTFIYVALLHILPEIQAAIRQAATVSATAVPQVGASTTTAAAAACADNSSGGVSLLHVPHSEAHVSAHDHHASAADMPWKYVVGLAVGMLLPLWITAGHGHGDSDGHSH